jgi:hypothetical protein
MAIFPSFNPNYDFFPRKNKAIALPEGDSLQEFKKV